MAEIWTPESLRAFEEEVKAIYLTGKIRAPIHLRRGGEEQLIEIFQGVHPEDWCFGTYRAHLHCLLKGIPREQVMAEILAGHSIHLEFPDYRFYSSAIVAGCLPIALGTALGLKRQGKPENVWCFCGDMAAETGAFHEASVYARRQDLPVTFIIEDNGLSVLTDTQDAWGRHPGAGDVRRYAYVNSPFPHAGAGRRVDF